MDRTTSLPPPASGNTGYTRVDNALLPRLAAIGPHGIGVYVALRSFADARGYCFPSIDAVAARCGASPSSVKRCLAAMVQEEIITRRQRNTGSGRASSEYSVCPSLEDDPTGHTDPWAPTPRVTQTQPTGHCDLAHGSHRPKNKNHLTRTIEQTSSPLPPPSVKEEEVSLDGWEEIHRRLRGHGMADVTGAIDAARQAGLDPPTVVELIDQWEAKQLPVAAWNVGGLHWRLTRGTWPPESDAYQAAQRKRHAAAETAARRTEERRVRSVVARDDQSGDDLETIVGADLDALDRDALRDLAEKVFPDEWLRRAAMNRQNTLYRRELLEALAARRQEAAA